MHPQICIVGQKVIPVVIAVCFSLIYIYIYIYIYTVDPYIYSISFFILFQGLITLIIVISRFEEIFKER